MDLGWPLYDCIEYRSTSKDTWMRVHGCFIAPMIMTNLKEMPDGERTISLLASIQASRSYPRYIVGLNSRYKRNRTSIDSLASNKTKNKEWSVKFQLFPRRESTTSFVSRIQAHGVRCETVLYSHATRKMPIPWKWKTKPDEKTPRWKSKVRGNNFHSHRVLPRGHLVVNSICRDKVEKKRG